MKDGLDEKRWKEEEGGERVKRGGFLWKGREREKMIEHECVGGREKGWIRTDS